jgi:hypothetical protein
MTHNWNVYKIFSNGKRAKAPIYSFEYSESDVGHFFDNNIKKILVEKFGSKADKNEFSILRADLPQERIMEESLQEKNKKFRYKVFAKYMGEEAKEKMFECVLLFSPGTNWSWQWCVVHGGTTNIIDRISPETNSYEAAHEWMNEEIQKL